MKTFALLLLPFAFLCLSFLVSGCENPRVEYNPYNPTVNRPVDTRPTQDKVDSFRQRVQEDLQEMR